MKRALCVIVVVLAATAVIFASGCGEQKQEPEYIGEETKEVKTEKTTVGDIEVAYREQGEGEPILLVMGYSGTMNMWDPDVLERLAEEYRVITFDNRGMGGTTAGTNDFTMEQFADDTAGLMDSLGIESAHVLGWSMGADIAQELVLRHPYRVKKLILYAADPGGSKAVQPGPEVMKQMTDTSGTAEARGERLLRLLVPVDWLEQNLDYMKEVFSGSVVTAPPENVARQTVAMEMWAGSYDRLQRIMNQTLLLTGTEDVLTPPRNSFIIAESVPGAWLVQIKGGGHGVMYQCPDEFSTIVLDFLDAPQGQ